MFLKRICLFIISAGIYTSIMVNHPSPALKELGYQQALNSYGGVCADRLEISILYQPGVRRLNGAYNGKIAAIIPGGSIDYPRLLDRFLEQGCRAIVECSALDAWHTTEDGQKYLKKMHGRAYRVVVFDGGHHLPTLGLAPDIIVMPVTNGYAAHSRALDGIRAQVVSELAREAGCRAVVASVPRWGLVKAEPSLIRITERIIADSPVSDNEIVFRPRATDGASCSQGICFAFVERECINDQDALNRKLDSLSIKDIHKIYLAFDYRYIDVSSADDYCRSLSRHCQVPVIRANEPVTVASAIFPLGVGEDELSQSVHYFENH
ncbi:MAG: hypothetical protein ACM3PE_01265 [Deltaproteobacteria bacterium]